MIFKLPVDVKKKWVAALRSGEYKQGFGKLKSVSRLTLRFCCLGVACDLGLAIRDPDEGYVNPEFLPKSVQRTLALLNDEERVNFVGLAAFIEREL